MSQQVESRTGQSKPPSALQAPHYLEIAKFRGNYLRNINLRVKNLQWLEDIRHSPRSFPYREAINVRNEKHRDYLISSIIRPGEKPETIEVGLAALNQLAVLGAKPEDVRIFVVSQSNEGKIVYDVDWRKKPESLIKAAVETQEATTLRAT